jgi:cytoskeletal protein RodZ
VYNLIPIRLCLLTNKAKRWYYAFAIKKTAMLKQKNKKTASKNLIFVILGILIVVLLLVFLERSRIRKLFNSSTSSTTTSNGPTPAQKKAEDAVNADNKLKAVDKGATPQTTNPDTTPASSQTITLSAKQETNNTVTIYTKLLNISSGTCNLSISNNGASYAKSAAIIYQAEFSSCAGFSVPISGLGAGTWQITLEAVSAGASKSQTISFKVI